MITCWTLIRFSLWIVDQDRKVYLEPLLSLLCSLMVTNDKTIQHAACQAITQLQSSTHVNLIEYFEPIVKTYLSALRLYQVSINKT